MQSRETFPEDLVVTNIIAQKIRSRFEFMKVTWIIFYLIVLGFFIYALWVIIESLPNIDYRYDRYLLIKRILILICCIGVFYFTRRLEKYIINSVKNFFVIGINLKNEEQFELITINQNRYSLSYSKDIQIKRRSNYAVGWFIYRSIRNWGKGQEFCFRIELEKTRFYIIPSFFEDSECVYSFLNKLSPNFDTSIE